MHAGPDAQHGAPTTPQSGSVPTHAPPSPLPAFGRSGPPQRAGGLRAPLAKIDEVRITIGEFQERLNRQSPYIRARYTSLEKKKEFLATQIQFEVLAKEAYRRGLDKDPEVVRT